MGEFEEMPEEPEQEEVIDRSDLNIQQFMNDMSMIGRQVNNRELDKPNFDYGDLAVTNYLLWLMLGELMLLNGGKKEE